MIAISTTHLVTWPAAQSFHIFATNQIATVTIKACQWCHSFLVDVTNNYYP